MAAKKKTTKVKSTELKSKELFDFVNSIYSDQTMDFYDNLTEDEKKKYKYSRYMINRFISMNPMYAPVVNAVQKYTQMPDRAHYQFLVNMIPKGRQFNKYIKGDKDSKYEGWLVDLMVKHFEISIKEAIQYLDLLYEKDISVVVELCKMYGVDAKLRKKAGL